VGTFITGVSLLRISVVTAVLNRQKTIADTLHSVATQDYAAVEHIIQDGQSDDGTLDIIQQIAGPQALTESCADTGIYDAINKGLTRVSGDVVGLLHSDDTFADPHVLSEVARMMEENPDLDGLYGDLDYVSATDTSRIVRAWRSGEYSPQKLRQGWMLPHPTLYLRREVFERWGLYDTGYGISADYDAVLRYLTVGKVRLGYLPKVMVKMRTGGASNGSLRAIWQKSCEDYRIIRTHHIGGFAVLAQKNIRKISQLYLAR
jgi:glycosyltransferase